MPMERTERIWEGGLDAFPRQPEEPDGPIVRRFRVSYGPGTTLGQGTGLKHNCCAAP